MRRRSKKFIILLFLTYLLLKLVNFKSIFYKKPTDHKPNGKNFKSVQLITWKFTNPNWTFRDLGSEPFRNCPESRCFAFYSNNILYSPDENADAVVVHGPNLWFAPPKRYKRKPRQLWMFNSMEPQRLSHCSSHYQLADLDNWFNLTATFKKDSDIVLDYKTFRNWSQIEHESIFVNEYKARRQKKNLIQAIQDLSSKSKKASVVWFVSHCETNSKREDYVKELMKYVNVDVFGKCSKNFHQTENKEPCSASPDGDCFKKFMNRYKFRLAFENSLCTDYITEKFWSMYNPEFIFDVHSVPIVRGARDYQYKKDVPFENFYINSQNFNSPKDLADYLNYLDANHTAYLEFFKWKVDLFKKIEENLKNSKIVTSYLNLWFEGVTFLNKAPFCRLCEYLHNETFLSNHEHNRRWILSEWFGPSQNCWDSDETNFALEILTKFFGYCM